MTYSCTSLVYDGKVDSHHFYGQGWTYCDQQMDTIDEVLYAYRCSFFLGMETCSEAYQLGAGCTYTNTQGTWCPLSGTYTSRSEPTGSRWRVYLETDVYPYYGQGNHLHAQVVGDPITF